LKGTFTDSDQTIWAWECDIESEIERESDEINGEGWFDNRSTDGFRSQDLWMEWVLWLTFLSGFSWIIGYGVLLPLGFFSYFIWINLWSTLGFF